MKKRVALLGVFMLWCSMLLWAQKVPDGLVSAFEKGNAAALGRFLGSQVELIIDNSTLHADKQKVSNRLATFFADNKVHNFQLLHQGKRNESGFVIGILSVENGHFRVNCFFKKNGNQYVIHQIRIDKSNE